MNPLLTEYQTIQATLNLVSMTLMIVFALALWRPLGLPVYRYAANDKHVPDKGVGLIMASGVMFLVVLMLTAATMVVVESVVAFRNPAPFAAHDALKRIEVTGVD